jgi:predicted XRE-type DNA-binding protein
MRSQLMMRIEDFCRQSDMTQAAAAKVLGITQPRLNALLKGKIGQFSLDALVNIANRAGLNVRLVITKIRGQSREPADASWNRFGL